MEPLHKSQPSIPIVAFLGHGRAGKDTCAEFMAWHTALVYKGGCSWTARNYMAKRLSAEAGRVITPEEAYENRHKDRVKWYNWLNEYRAANPSQLIRDCLEHSDVICGVRDGNELRAAVREDVIDLTIWVERPGTPVDPTVTYTIDDCDMVLHNNGDLNDLYKKLTHLAQALRLPLR